MKLLETQVALVEANEGVAVIPSLGMLVCRNREVTMSERVDPLLNLNFYQISSRGSRLSDEAKEFSGFLKMYMASWAPELTREWARPHTFYASHPSPGYAYRSSGTGNAHFS